MELGGPVGLAHQGIDKGKAPPRGPDGTVLVRHRRPKGLAIARWHKHTWDAWPA
jgi:hypothetical protein